MRNEANGNLAFAAYGDIFDVTLKPNNGEYVVEILLTALHPPEFNPFQVIDDASMTRLAKSVKQYGVREPGIARPRADGGYELLVGNRRKRACELAEIAAMPVIVRELDDINAQLIMVDSNLDHRERILLSEKAWAYRVMMDALNHSGVKGEKHSYKIMAERTGESKNQIYRIIRLTELIAALADMVDAKQIAFNPAVELSYLSIPEQIAVVDVMAKYEIRPSFAQATRLKALKKGGKLTLNAIDAILSEVKKPPKSAPTGSARFRKYFPPEYSPEQMDRVIIKLLTAWKARRAS